jgi:hypothetical protein
MLGMEMNSLSKSLSVYIFYGIYRVSVLLFTAIHILQTQGVTLKLKIKNCDKLMTL